MKRNLIISFAFLIYLVSLTAGCSQEAGQDPKSAVIQMFGAMERDDKSALARLLDLPELMKNINEDYSLQTETPRVFTNPQDLLDDMTEDGLTKQRWFSYQRIINKAEVMGETATVEVTFVDKENSQGYRTKFGVHLKQGKWRIYSFKTITGN